MSMIPILEYAMNSDSSETPLPALLLEREYYRLIAEELAKDRTPEQIRAAVLASKAELRSVPGVR